MKGMKVIKKQKLWMLAAIVAFCGIASFALCPSRDGGLCVTVAVPQEPNYAEASQWYTIDRHGEAASNLLLVDGYTATDYVLPLIGKEGNYHSREIWLYRDQLRENMQLRTTRWLQAH